MKVTRATRIAVLMGGPSREREVSLKSGRAVLEALRSRGWDAVGIDAGSDLPARIREVGAGAAWIALHGAYGEDGCVQGLLEWMRVPYTGSGPEASALAMDKAMARRLAAEVGVAVAPGRLWRPGEPPPPWTGPVAIKAPHGGSTLDLEICREPDAFPATLDRIAQVEGVALVERVVEGEEITVAVLDGRSLPVVGIRPVEGHFDYEAKYRSGRTVYDVPARIPGVVAQAAQEAARRVFRHLGLSGLARADFIVDGEGTPVFLEVNTIPGMTATSLSPMAASAEGIPFEELVERVLLGARLHLEPASDLCLSRVDLPE